MDKIDKIQRWVDGGKVGGKVRKSEWESGVLHGKWMGWEEIHGNLREIYTEFYTELCTGYLY